MKIKTQIKQTYSLVSVSLLSLALVQPSFAADRKVPTATYPTITAAVAAAQPGDRIMVGPGVYQEHVTTSVSNLQFIGRSAIWDGTLTNGTAGVCLNATGDNITVQGFTFRAGQSGTAQVQINGANAKISRCNSRGPAGRFLRITGSNAVVENVSLFAVNSTAIQIIGNGAVVRKLKARHTDDNVVRVEGARATVTGCSFLVSEDSYSISIVGADAAVARNTFVYCDGAIFVAGDRALIERNKLLHSGNLNVSSDDVIIRNNTISGAPNDADGIEVAGSTVVGGGIIERNTIRDVTQFGLLINLNNAVIRNNRVTGSGTEGTEGCILLAGSGNRLTNNAAISSGSHAFNITGANNILVKCTAIDAAADGFHITGNENSLFMSDAMLCSGEGLDNGGADTTVTQSMFKRNRIDVANDGTFTNAGTFAADNTFSTGGPTQAPQVD